MQLNAQTHEKFVQMVASAAHVATVTPATGVDCLGFAELAVVINVGTYVGAATGAIALQESSASDGSGDAFATWTGSSFTAISHSTDSRLYLGRIKLEGRKRYIRAVLTYSGDGTTEVAPTGIVACLVGANNTNRLTQTYGVATT